MRTYVAYLAFIVAIFAPTVHATNQPLQFGEAIRPQLQYFASTFLPSKMLVDHPCHNIEATTFTSLTAAQKQPLRVCTLYIEGSGLVDLNGQLDKFIHLQLLSVHRASPLQLPNALPALPRLQQVEFINTELTELPTTLSNWQALYSLNVSNNSLQELPSSIQNLPKLLYVSVEHNQLPKSEVDKLRSVLPEYTEVIADF